ncbi:MAG TPA: endo-1,4-beta-xylanase [Leptolyngbyaceae cyanobacterium]
MTKKRILTRRRTFLLGVGAFTLISGARYLNDRVGATANEKRDFKVAGAKSLRDRAAAKGLIYGAASSKRPLSLDAKFKAGFIQNCAILVPEWELNWDVIHPTPDRFDFSRVDWLSEFTRAHKMLFRGIPLVWHVRLPQWFADKVDSRNAEQILRQHVSTVVSRYAGKVHSWDVVNEAFKLADGRSDGLRNTPWLQFLGPDYIEIAFRTAAEADPKALLVYNDYGFDYDTREDEAKRTTVLKFLERLLSRKLPIQALGIQAHLRGEDRDKFNSRKLRAFLHDVASMGLKILITEMDVTDQNLPKDINERDRIVAGMYEDYLSVVLDEPAVIAVLTWGLSDRYSWLSSYKPRPDKAPVRPLPFDAQMQRKLAWNAIARAFDKAPKR